MNSSQHQQEHPRSARSCNARRSARVALLLSDWQHVCAFEPVPKPLASANARLFSKHFAHLDPPCPARHHTPTSAGLMVKLAGLRPQGVKSFSAMNALVATIGNRRGSALPRPARIASEPLSALYRAVSQASGQGELVTVWAIKPT